MYKTKKTFLVLFSLFIIFISHTVLADTIQCPKHLDFKMVSGPGWIVFGKILNAGYYLDLAEPLKKNWEERTNDTKEDVHPSPLNWMSDDTKLTIYLYSSAEEPQKYLYQTCSYLLSTTHQDHVSDFIVLRAKQPIDNPDALMANHQWKFEVIFDPYSPNRVLYTRYACTTTAGHPEACYQ